MEKSISNLVYAVIFKVCIVLIIFTCVAMIMVAIDKGIQDKEKKETNEQRIERLEMKVRKLEREDK